MDETRPTGGDHLRPADPARVTPSSIVFVAVAYFVLGRLSFAASFEHDIVTMVIFGAEGLSLAAAIRWGRRAAYGVFVGQLLLALSMGLPLAPALGVALANAGECVVASVLARRFDLRAPLVTVRAVFTLFALSGFVLQPLSATLGVGVLFASGRMSEASIGTAWLAWVLGNFIGQCTVAPALLALFESSPQRLARAAVAALAVAGVGALAFGLVVTRGVPTFALALALTMPLLLAVSVWLGVEASAIATLASTVAAVWATAMGVGPFAHSWLELDLFVVGATFMSIATSAAFEERRALEATLRCRNVELERTNHGLASAMRQVKTLRGLVPICASCKSIRLPDGQWKQLEEVLTDKTEATLTHGICADCAARLYGYRKDVTGALRRVVPDTDLVEPRREATGVHPIDGAAPIAESQSE